ncbi:MAG: 1-acyl-sn-glycerol-3-phosphate acyltransferase [Limisphaerales bacterium]|jgi:1-acyl-sn-glycerol-3-phosphate acyltransferase
MVVLESQLINTMTQAQPAIEISRIKQFFCTLILVACIVSAVLTLSLAKLLRFRWLQLNYPLLFHRVICRLVGLQVVVKGEPISDVPTLFVSNHATYMDIFVLGKLIPGAFVAKAEVAGWPIFGKLAGLQNTLFLERRAVKAREQIGVVRKRLAEQGNLIMFPEGTSTSGDYVARFRSSLFAATEDVVIQPVTVAYSHYRGERMSAEQRDYYAWYLPDPANAPGVNNTPFVEHLLQGMGLGPARVEVIFHKPTRISEDFSRKACAEACEAVVRSGLENALGIQQDDAELASSP